MVTFKHTLFHSPITHYIPNYMTLANCQQIIYKLVCSESSPEINANFRRVTVACGHCDTFDTIWQCFDKIDSCLKWETLMSSFYVSPSSMTRSLPLTRSHLDLGMYTMEFGSVQTSSISVTPNMIFGLQYVTSRGNFY